MQRRTTIDRPRALVTLVLGAALAVSGTAWAQRSEAPSSVAPPEPDRVSILRSAGDRAIEVVLDASQSGDPRARAAALEAAQSVPSRARPLLQLALSDENAGVRFAALVVIGQLQLDGLGPAAYELAGDPNPSVRGAALFAAHRCGEGLGQELSYLAWMLGSQDPVVRGNAAMLLGLIGDEGAIPMLEEIAYTPMPRVDPTERLWLQLQFAEAILRIQPDNEEMLEVLRASIYSPIDDLRVLSLRIAADIRFRLMVPWLGGMIDGEDPIQVRVAAARSLAQMGGNAGRQLLSRGAGYSARAVRQDAQAYVRANRNRNDRAAQLMRELLEDPTAQADIAADIRAQSAFGLGHLPGEEPAHQLVSLLEDEHPAVRLAAAAAVLEALARDAQDGFPGR